MTDGADRPITLQQQSEGATLHLSPGEVTLIAHARSDLHNGAACRWCRDQAYLVSKRSLTQQRNARPDA